MLITIDNETQLLIEHEQHRFRIFVHMIELDDQYMCPKFWEIKRLFERKHAEYLWNASN